MIGKTNGKRAATPVSEMKYYIAATYPSESTCACTDGVNTFTAEDTSGLYVFPIPYAGDWTVSSTDGFSSASEIVTVSNVFNCTLDYGKIWNPFDSIDLWNKGNLVTTYESPGRVSTTGTSTITENGFLRATMYESGWPCYSMFLNGVKLKNYNSVNIEYDSTKKQWDFVLGIWSSRPDDASRKLASTDLVASADGGAKIDTVSFDVSSITDDRLYYIGFYMETGAIAQTTVDIWRVQLI